MEVLTDGRFLFDGIPGLVRILVTVPLLYLAVVASIRISGKRSTSQMNNFDWIVTVAIGSLVASGAILKDVSLLETLLAITLFLGCQYATTRLTLRFETVKDMVKAEPTLLFHKGAFLRDAMDRERVSEDEIMAALRENGLGRKEDVAWVILETNATLSVIPRSDETNLSDATTLSPVQGKPKRSSD